MSEISFTDRELDIMAVLWEHGPMTTAEVRRQLSDDLAYNTVQTMLRIMEDKGHVRHEAEGRAHRFYPLVGRHEAERSALRRMVRRLFRGSPSLLMTQFVHSQDLSDEELLELRRVIDDQLRGGEEEG
jgi:BlaI family transcriptional regulator, penicillinase repressor